MTGLSAINRLDVGSAMLRGRLEVQSRQLSDGRKGIYLGDIAPGTRRAIDLRGEINRRAAYTSGITQTLGLTATAQNALQSLYGIATRAFALAQSAGSANPQAIRAAATEARAALEQAAQTLDQSYGGQYIFGGKDSANPPIPDPSNIAQSGMVLDIAAAVQGLSAGNAAAVAASTLATASSDAAGTTPFSDYISDPGRGLTEERRTVPAADGQLVAIGLFANRNASGSVQGNTTGSWSRDLLRGLASLAALDPAQATLGTDFDSFMEDVRTGLRASINGIAQEQGSLGVAEKRLETMKAEHESVTTTLTSQLSDIEDVDLAAVITAMQATQTQLEASYRAISLASQLTLTRFI